MPSDALRRIQSLPPVRAKLMEVCGTHTMAIAKSGIKRLLPEGVTQLSGPGCPVCVTPPEVIDAVLSLAMEKNVTVATYGDLLRVPGSVRGDNLSRRRALGAGVEIVYSPMDALELAESEPQREVVFLGAGFETTAPGTAAAVLSARERDLKNFTVFSMLKRVEPSLRALIGSEGFSVDAFLCPGHVAVITGAESFRFLPREYSLPAAVAGFEPEDILSAIYELLRMLSESKPELVNCYERAVSPRGNALALETMEKVFVPRRDIWRGLGAIEDSGLGFRQEFSDFDAERRFDLSPSEPVPTACRCGEVITGRLSPTGCPLFGKVCTPSDPVGPCMVSSEGACAAEYKYQVV